MHEARTPTARALHLDRARAESFGSDAELYDRARPGYPEAMLDALLQHGAHKVLDVGCGTGIVAGLLKGRGCEVLGVEPDERMARVARERGLHVEHAHFEDWQAHGRRFELLTCGQAWHWIDPERGAAKAAEVLLPGARVAIFWNFGRPPQTLRAALAPIYARMEPALERHSVLLGNADGRVQLARDALERSEAFGTVELASWRLTRRYSTEQWLEALLSHSDHQALPLTRRRALFESIAQALEDLGGAFEMTYITQLLSSWRSASGVRSRRAPA